jgi:hypothetical protein
MEAVNKRISMKIISYSICKPIEGVCKQYTIGVMEEDGKAYPLVYLQKPKHIIKEAWDEICQAISISLPQDFGDKIFEVKD